MARTPEHLTEAGKRNLALKRQEQREQQEAYARALAQKGRGMSGTSVLGKRRADTEDEEDAQPTKRRVPAASSSRALSKQPAQGASTTSTLTSLASASSTQARRAADATSANIQVAVRVRGQGSLNSTLAGDCCLITEGTRSDTLTVFTEPGTGVSTAPTTSSLLPFGSPIKQSRGKAGAAPDTTATSSKGKPKADATAVSNRRMYNFDHVFGPGADQNMVYQDVAAPIISDVLDGYNCTIFCYGQTGTGKTHTMEGDLSPHPSSGTFASGAGIIPRTLFRIFHQLEKSGAEFSVRVTYVELYNEEARDLLAEGDFSSTMAADETSAQPSKATTKKTGILPKAGTGPKSQAATNNNRTGIRILNDSKTGVKLEGVEEVPITSAEHGLDILRRGSAKRHVASTNCNSQSSRSHSIFTLTIHHTTTNNLSSSQSGPAPGTASGTCPPVLGADGQPSAQVGEDVFRIGKLNLVDLAGSENIGRSGAADRQAKEAGMINQSLLTLGRVINALVEKQSHIPFRESKLTRLLQESLGGRTKTCIIATVSDLRTSMDETLSTLEYATRARSIQTRPEINARTTRTALLSEYIAENLRLREDLKVTRARSGVYLSPEQMQKMDQDYATAVTEKGEIKAQFDLAQSEIQSVQEQLEQNSAVLARKEEEARTAKLEVERLKGLNEQLRTDWDTAKHAKEVEEKLRVGYQQNGQTLNEVAEGFKGMVKHSVQELDQMHAAIEKGAVDAQVNYDLIDQLGTAVQEGLTQIDTETQSFKVAQERFASGVSSSLQTLWAAQEQAGNRALTELSDGCCAVRDLLLGVAHESVVINENGSRLAEQLGSIQEAIREASLTRHNELSAAIKTILTDVGSLVQAFGRETSSGIAQATQIAEKMNKDVAELVDGAKEQVSMFQTQVAAKIEEERQVLDAERAQLDKALAEERVRAKSARDAFMTTVRQAARQYTQESVEAYEGLVADSDAALTSRDGMLNERAQEQEDFAKPLQQQLAGLAEGGGESMKTVLTGLQTIEGNSAMLHSGVDEVFEDFRVKVLEPSDRQVEADNKEMQVQIADSAGFITRSATASSHALNDVALEMKRGMDRVSDFGKASLSAATRAFKQLTDSVSKQTKTQDKTCIQYTHDCEMLYRSLLTATERMVGARVENLHLRQGVPVRHDWTYPETWEVMPNELTSALTHAQTKETKKKDAGPPKYIFRWDNVSESSAPEASSAAPVRRANTLGLFPRTPPRQTLDRVVEDEDLESPGPVAGPSGIVKHPSISFLAANNTPGNRSLDTPGRRRAGRKTQVIREGDVLTPEEEAEIWRRQHPDAGPDDHSILFATRDNSDPRLFTGASLATAGPSAIPAVPSLATAGPSAIPAVSSLASAGPSAIPAVPSLASAGPSAIPVVPSLASAGPSAIPAVPSLASAGPSTLTSRSSLADKLLRKPLLKQRSTLSKGVIASTSGSIHTSNAQAQAMSSAVVSSQRLARPPPRRL